jgi:hypothetical protein
MAAEESIPEQVHILMTIITDYFIKNPVFLQYSNIYFLVIIFITVIAVVTRYFQKRKLMLRKEP